MLCGRKLDIWEISMLMSPLSCKPKQSKFPLIQPEMSGRSFSIILFIIFGENMAELPRAQETRSADEKSSQQNPLWKSADCHSSIWKSTTATSNYNPIKPPWSCGRNTSVFNCKTFFFPLELCIIFCTDWNSRPTQSWTEMLNPWDQDASSRINTQRPDPHSTITLSPMCQ